MKVKIFSSKEVLLLSVSYVMSQNVIFFRQAGFAWYTLKDIPYLKAYD